MSIDFIKENVLSNDKESKVLQTGFFGFYYNGKCDKDLFKTFIKEQVPEVVKDINDGKEVSYLVFGGEIGDQQNALILMAAGEELGLWELLTPQKMLPDLDPMVHKQMAGAGLITITKIDVI